MLVRYRTYANITAANLQLDLHNIITGNIANVSQLSSGADQGNCSIIGSYPAGVYTVSNASTYTYAKVHNSVGTYTHYFRLGFDSANIKLANISLAQSYTSGTDTLVNGTTAPVGIKPQPYNQYYPDGIDIIINNKAIHFHHGSSGSSIGVFDLGHSGVTRTYTSSMLMCINNLNNVTNYGANNGIVVPYMYNYDTLAYGNVTFSSFHQPPLRKTTSTGNVVITENPVFAISPNTANVTQLVYSFYKVPLTTLPGTQVYRDYANAARWTYHDYTITVD